MIQRVRNIEPSFWSSGEAKKWLADELAKVSRNDFMSEAYAKIHASFPPEESWTAKAHVSIVAGKTSFFFEPAEWTALVERAEMFPMEVGDDGIFLWWLYANSYYKTKEELDDDEVLALIEEKENRKKLKIARAKTVASMASQLGQQDRRQSIPREVKVAVWQRDKGKCVQCGGNGNLEFDHIIPHSLGGSDTERNLQLLCAECNREKGASI